MFMNNECFDLERITWNSLSCKYLTLTVACYKRDLKLEGIERHPQQKYEISVDGTDMTVEFSVVLGKYLFTLHTHSPPWRDGNIECEFYDL